MRLSVTLFLAWICLGLDAGLRSNLSIGQSNVAPWFSLPLVVFIALNAPALHTLWTAFIIGAVVDLSSPRTLGLNPDAVIFGPYTLGFCSAAYCAMTLRGVMIRKSRVAVAAMSVVAAVCVAIVSVAVLALQSLYNHSFQYSAVSELLTGLGSAAYTGASALLIAALLIPMHPYFHFHEGSSRKYSLR